MDIKEIRAVCEVQKERDCRNIELCKALSPVDEGFIYHIDRDILNHSPEMSALENIDAILNGERDLSESTGNPYVTKWYNSYPFGAETDVIHSRFLGICRGKTKLDAVLKEAIRHSDNVAKCCDEYYDRTTVILTDKWDVKTFAKYEKAFIRYACLHDIFPIFLLVTDYGYTQIPFLPNDRKKLHELVPDVDNERKDALWLFNNLPVEYIEQGSIVDFTERLEYTFFFNDRRWECKRPHCGMMSGTFSGITARMFFKDVLWIADAKEKELNPDSRGVDTKSYALYVFGKKVFWDDAAIDSNGDPRFIKLNEAIKLLTSSLKRDD